MFFTFDLDFVTFFLCVCVSHASRVMLDVLIIGGGPHALTLATLLSCPDQALSPPPPNTDILQGIQLSQGRAKTSRSKNKRGGATSEANYTTAQCFYMSFS